MLPPITKAVVDYCFISGYISVRRPLDRETVSEYHLTMRAEDGGGLYCTTEVYISITDVNDNAPVFTQSTYTVMVPEDAEISTLVTRVSATDYDLGMYWVYCKWVYHSRVYRNWVYRNWT